MSENQNRSGSLSSDMLKKRDFYAGGLMTLIGAAVTLELDDL